MCVRGRGGGARSCLEVLEAAQMSHTSMQGVRVGGSVDAAAVIDHPRRRLLPFVLRCPPGILEACDDEDDDDVGNDDDSSQAFYFHSCVCVCWCRVATMTQISSFPTYLP